MILLFFKLWTAELRAHFARFFIAFLGIVFGISGYASIRLANTSVVQSISDVAHALRPRAPYTVRHPAGSVPEEIILSFQYSRVEFYPRIVRNVAARVGSRYVGIVTLLGVDLLKEGSIGAIQSIAGDIDGFSNIATETLSLTIAGREQELRIKPLQQEFPGNVVIVDIAIAQRLLGEYGFVDELGVSERIDVPPPLQLTLSESMEGELLHASHALRLNLRFLAALSLVVCSLLIYTSVSYLLLKRRRDLGILLAIGAKPRMVLQVLLLESALLGLLGAAFGTVLGAFISKRVVQELAQTISGLYFPVEARTFPIDGPLLAEFLAIGIITSLAGSIVPIRRESQRALRVLLSPQTYEQIRSEVLRRGAYAGILCLVATPLLTWTRALGNAPILGFLPAATLALGWILVSPQLSQMILSVLARLPLPVLSQVVVKQFRASPRKVSATVAATGVAVGLFLGVSTMIGSFRSTVENWLETILKADLFISAEHAVSGESPSNLSPEMVLWFRSHPKVVDVETVRARRINLDGRRVILYGVRFDLLEKYRRVVLLKEFHQPGVLLSESFASHFGEKLSLPGVGDLPVKGIFFDYSSDSGIVYLPEDLFQTLFQTSSLQSLAMYAKDPGDAAEIARQFQNSFPDSTLILQSGPQLRRKVMDIFDQTFSITRAIQVLTLLISLFVITNTVMMLRFERRRENALLVALGVERMHVRSIAASEGLCLGLCAAFSGILQGFSFSLLIVFFVNKFFFGWSSALSIPWSTYLSTFAVVALLPAILGWLMPPFGEPSDLREGV